MARKFYLRATTSWWRVAGDYGIPTAGEKSATQPTQANVYSDSARDSYYLDEISGNVGNFNYNVPAATYPKSVRVGRWTSLPLLGGSYGSGTWTVAAVMASGGAAGGMFLVNGSLYFWRPSDSSVVGYVADGDTIQGAALSQSATGLVRTFTGADVTIQTGDCLVYEMWVRSSGGSASVGITIYCDSSTDAFAGADTTAGGAYLQAPAEIPIQMNARWG